MLNPYDFLLSLVPYGTSILVVGCFVLVLAGLIGGMHWVVKAIGKRCFGRVLTERAAGDWTAFLFLVFGFVLSMPFLFVLGLIHAVWVFLFAERLPPAAPPSDIVVTESDSSDQESPQARIAA